MKTTVLIGATLAVLGLAVAPANAQTQSSTSTSYVPASKIVGMKVKDSRGEEVGIVKDVVLDRNTGCMAYTVLSAGGTTGPPGAALGTRGRRGARPERPWLPGVEVTHRRLLGP